jgi:hypothetical protein
MLRLDGNLHAELNADIQKELNMELNRAKTSQKEKKDNDIVKVIICSWRPIKHCICICNLTSFLLNVMYLYVLLSYKMISHVKFDYVLLYCFV